MFRIAQWTIGEIDVNHMSISTTLTADIYRSDGTVHPGPRLDWQGTHLVPTHMAIADKNKECPAALTVNKRSAPACDFFLKGGDGFIEIGDWRFGNVDDIHFVFSHRDGRSSVLYRWDGNQYPNWGQNYGNNYGIWRKPVYDRATGLTFGDNFIDFNGKWRIAQMDNNHISLGHVTGNTAMIWRIDGTKHPGPRRDWNGFTVIRSYKTRGISKGDLFVQIGVWRFQDWGDNNHFSIGTGFTTDIYRKDGTVHPGPRLDWTKEWVQPTDRIERCSETWRKQNEETCGMNPQGGDGFIQIGSWRFGNVDNTHFSFSHKLGNTAIIFRSDGTVHGGPRRDFGLWHLEYKESATNVVLGDYFVEFGGYWRLALIDQRHFSISHKSGKTAFIWRVDGTRHGGPRDDFNGFVRKGEKPVGIRWDYNILEIGEFRLAEIDPNHMSISTPMTADIYRSDGTIHPGPRWDWSGSHLSANNIARSKGDC